MDVPTAVPPNTVPAFFTVKSLTLAIGLIDAGFTKCRIFADLLGSCRFEFPDSPDLQRAVDEIQAGRSRIEPYRFVRLRSQLRTKMDEAIAAVREEAESDLEGRALLQRLEHARRTEEVLNLPNPWKAIRATQLEAERRELGQRLERLDRASQSWTRGSVWGSDSTTGES